MDVLEDNREKELDIYPYMKRCTLDIICGNSYKSPIG